ncbi:MAG: PaaI family thioesterase [Acidimicrobiales bacterium]
MPDADDADRSDQTAAPGPSSASPAPLVPGARPTIGGLSPVLSRIGARPDAVDEMRGTIVSRSAIRRHERLRPATLMMLADVVVGMRHEARVEEWTFTTDYSWRLADRRPVAEGETITAAARELRIGRRLIIEAVDYLDDSGALLASTQITFMRTPQRPGDDPKPDISGVRALMAGAPEEPLETPLVEAAGLEIIDAAAGTVRLEISDRIRRPGGMVQGSIMTLLGEVAAETMAEHTLGGPCIVTGLDVRYLLGGRTGPLVTRSSWVGPPERGTVAVDVVDTGRDDALTTTFYVQVEPL